MGFIRFIHRTVTDPQAEEMVERIGKGLVDVLSELVNQADHAKRSHDIARWRRMARGHEPAMIAKAGQGYIQKIDYPGLLNWCAENNCCMQIRIRAGDFVVDGVCAHRVCGSRPEVLNRSVEHRNRYIVTGPVRTSIQDPEYPITQLNQLAARALSPGINAPGTAISCVDSFSLALAEIVDRDMPGCVFLDGE
jgi:uncharacterized membrane protein